MPLDSCPSEYVARSAEKVFCEGWLSPTVATSPTNRTDRAAGRIGRSAAGKVSARGARGAAKKLLEKRDDWAYVSYRVRLSLGCRNSPLFRQKRGGRP